MKILAIDPGTTESAYLLFDTTLIKIIEFAKIPNNDIFKIIFERDWEILAIEGIVSYGMPVGADTLQTIFWYGRFYQYAKENYKMDGDSEFIYVVSRQEIKMQHCKRTSKVTDGNVSMALQDKYGAPGTKKNQGFTYGLAGDTWSAFAIATYIYEKHILNNEEILNIVSEDLFINKKKLPS